MQDPHDNFAEVLLIVDQKYPFVWVGFHILFFKCLELFSLGVQLKKQCQGDATEAVWKAPAGKNADFKGISGLRLQLKDSDNELLNSAGINAIRKFPDGFFCWGARTLDGDDSSGSEWKYIPVRRTALFIEESLYEGLNWVVFEPNDESLWEQIRLSTGVFMYDLFRAGALQGAKPGEAFFVKCDSNTTTQNDINNGIVNIEVGFAPLQPAEFIILNLQLITAQSNGGSN